MENFMRFLMGLTLVAICGMTVLAADAKFALTGDNTKIEFTGVKKDGKHDGGFKKLSGTASATGTDATTVKFEVTIETDSLWSDNPGLTTHLKNPDFFDVKTNPTAKFVSTKVEKKGDGYEVTGDLTLNGKTNPVTFPAKITVGEASLTLSSEFKIDRTKFGMTYGKGKINDEVDLRVKVEAKK
jgi:polyisoprenoid-binding protein YceI